MVRFCSRFLPVQRQFFFFLDAISRCSLTGEMLCLCKQMNQGVCSRPAGVGKFHKMTFVVDIITVTSLCSLLVKKVKWIGVMFDRSLSSLALKMFVRSHVCIYESVCVQITHQSKLVCALWFRWVTPHAGLYLL